MGMLLYSQRDPRWRSEQVGKSGRTMAQIGCLITCIAMLSSYFKPTRTPFDILHAAKFTPNGLLYWNSLKLQGFRFYKRVYSREDMFIQHHLSNPDLAVVLQVAEATHWVVGIGKTLIGNSYRIADPLLGDRSSMARYQESITGAAYFQRV